MNSHAASVRVLLILIAWLATGCGGGNGGGSEGNGVGEGLSLSAYAVTFSVQKGESPLPSQELTVSYGSGVYRVVVGYPPPITTAPSWLQVTQSGSGNPFTLRLAIAHTALPVGTHETKLRVATQSIDDSVIAYRDIMVTYVVKDDQRPKLSALTTDAADTSATSKLEPLTIASAGIKRQPSIGQAWIKFSSDSAVAPSLLQFSVDATGLPVGVFHGVVTVIDTQSGNQIAATVTLEHDAHKLLVVDDGVAFSSTPTRTHLNQTLTVSDSVGATTIPWTATADQPWLAVTRSGLTGGELTLRADPQGLAADTIHYAKVTIQSNDPTVTNTQTVRVGLYIGSVAPPASVPSNLSLVDPLADPIRPYVYAWSARSTEVEVYHIYTGAKIAAIAMPQGSYSRPANMAISSDGSMLYVEDPSHNLTPINLDTLQAGEKWLVTRPAGTVLSGNLKYLRPNGHPTLIYIAAMQRDVTAYYMNLLDATNGAPIDFVTYPQVIAADISTVPTELVFTTNPDGS